MSVVLLAGGTGGARLASGLHAVLPPGELTVVTNTADDDVFHGLLVCPDTDAVLYRLAGVFNEESGYGIAGETFNTLEMLRRYGAPSWFSLGDRDIATHLLRAEMLAHGGSLTEAVAELTRRLGVATAVVPMSDEPVRTRVLTDWGELSFQEYFVRERCVPAVRGIRLDGAASARPSPAAVAAIAAADVVIVGPSNPVISIGPILAILGDLLRGRRVAAVSPIVEGRALKGPTVPMMQALGEDPSPQGVLARYRSLATDFVLDRGDSDLASGMRGGALRVHVLDTVMRDHEGERRFASELLDALAAG